MSTIFVTERLIARRWTLEDVDAFMAVFGDPEMFRFMPGAAPETRDAALAGLERLLNRMAAWEQMGSFAVLDRARDAIVGNVLLRPLEDGPRIEVGYHIAKHWWGMGYATEIARGAVRYGFEQLGLNEIYGVVVPENVASKRVLQKAGLARIGSGQVYGLACDVMRIRRGELVGDATSS